MGRKTVDKHSLRLIERIVGQSARFSVEHQLLNWVLSFSGCIFVLTTLNNYLLAIPSLLVPLLSGSACLVGYHYSRVRRHFNPLLLLTPFLTYFTTTSDSWFTNAGIHGSVPFFAAMPILSATLLRQGWARALMVGSILLHLWLLMVVQNRYPALVYSYSSTAARQIDLLSSAFLVTLYGAGYMGILLHNLALRRQQSELLLANILPPAIAKELKEHAGQTIAHQFEAVSVMFADVADFTPLSAKLTPGALVALLDELFSDFDRLVEVYGVEKIKTIGDCYMVAAGTPGRRQDHAQVLVQMALEIQALLRQKTYQGLRLSLRIGINSGPVVAGIIGQKKFIYDLWGDVVNTASRMESHGQAGAIQITQSTYNLIADQFVCIPQGTIFIKGKGPLPIWHVLAQP